MMYLLDTNVVSESRKASSARGGLARIDRRVQAWVESFSASNLYLSAITILELEIGILLLERRDPPQGATLRFWMQSRVLPAFAGRILGVDTAVALRRSEEHTSE